MNSANRRLRSNIASGPRLDDRGLSLMTWIARLSAGAPGGLRRPARLTWQRAHAVTDRGTLWTAERQPALRLARIGRMSRDRSLAWVDGGRLGRHHSGWRNWLGHVRNI